MYYSFYFGAAIISGSAYLFSEHNYSVGGSDVLGLLIAVFIAIEQRVKEISSELRNIRLFIAVIIGLNLLSYWKVSSRNVNIIYLIIFFGALFWMLPQYSLLVFRSFRKSDDLDEINNFLIKKIWRTLWLPI